MSLIKLQLIGNLGGDATLNNVNGKTVVNFNVCHTEKYKDANGVENNKSTWVSCSFWSERTSIAQYIRKGNQIYVEGQPMVDTYSKDGRTFAQLRLRVSNIQLLGGNNQNNNQQQTQPQQQSNSNGNNFNNSQSEVSEPLDDLPF